MTKRLGILGTMVLGLALVVATGADAQGWGNATKILDGVTTTGASSTFDSRGATSVLFHVFSASTSTAVIALRQGLDGTNWYTSTTEYVTNPTSAGELWACPSTPYASANVVSRSAGTLSVYVSKRTMSGDPIRECRRIDQPATNSARTDAGNTFLGTQVFNQASMQGSTGTKALTAASATTFAKLTVGTGTQVTGRVFYSVEADDGTDFQSRSGILPFAAVNKAGTITCTVGTVGTATEVAAVSASTLTNTFTCADATAGVLNLLANAASGLTETTLQIKYRVDVLGTSTVTPQ